MINEDKGVLNDSCIRHAKQQLYIQVSIVYLKPVERHLTAHNSQTLHVHDKLWTDQKLSPGEGGGAPLII